MNLLDIAKSCEDIAWGVFSFLPHVPTASVDISAVVAELYAIGASLRSLDGSHKTPSRRQNFTHIATDLELVVRASLRQTLRDIYDSLSRMNQAIHITNLHNAAATAAGTPIADTIAALHKRTWDGLWHYFYTQAGYSLHLRLKYYKQMLEEMSAIAQGEVADEVMLASCRAAITTLRVIQDRQVAIQAQQEVQKQHQQHHHHQQQHQMPGQFPQQPPFHHHPHHPHVSASVPPVPPPPPPPPPPPAPGVPGVTPVAMPRAVSPDDSLEHILDPPRAPEPPKRKSSMKKAGSFERQRPNRKEHRDSIHWSNPTSPKSPVDSSSDTMSLSSNSFKHWAMKVYGSVTTSTPLRSTGDMTKCYGENMPEVKAHLDKGYIELLQLKFPGRPQVTFSFFLRDRDHRVRVLCKVKSDKRTAYSSTVITSLLIHREGSCLMLCHPSSGEEDRVAWANLQFSTLEYMVLFFCTFIALRGQDSSDPVSRIKDYQLDGEELVFSGETIDNHYIHALHIYVDTSTRAVRLHATVLHGELKHVPVWTAFIHQYVKRPRSWMRHVEQEVIYLTELQPTVFINSDEYKPSTTARGEHIITFTSSEDAVMFMESINEISHVLRKK
ncbi:hypothetical protein TESG_06911 [Trichophyton tonsurans CBS 112818]|uniref:Uncharacterized protein n=1 Tax=Trichophyton tonsurans (strain CBS 112818) TaxID=647933 RepID=F2S7C9_TRIT1|nr:hypothetical protein TESG_06911 [Trichophyton tonsurans CBS 112818]